MIESRDVPCDTCTACCRGEAILLHPERGDKPHEHRGNVVMLHGRWMLKHKPGTDECVYLGDRGCTLYGKPERPVVCAEFDCRQLARIERTLGKRLVPLSSPIRDAARRLRA